MSLSQSIKFTSERFDYRSELPQAYNAGNRFYGRDVAQFVAAQLTAQGFASDYLDEDWGWLILSTGGSNLALEVAIYNLTDHGEGGRPGTNEWGLWIRAHERRKILGLLPRRTEVAVPAQALAAVRKAVQAAGIEPQPWEDGPS